MKIRGFVYFENYVKSHEMLCSSSESFNVRYWYHHFYYVYLMYMFQNRNNLTM